MIEDVLASTFRAQGVREFHPVVKICGTLLKQKSLQITRTPYCGLQGFPGLVNNFSPGLVNVCFEIHRIKNLVFDIVTVDK